VTCQFAARVAIPFKATADDPGSVVANWAFMANCATNAWPYRDVNTEGIPSIDRYAKDMLLNFLRIFYRSPCFTFQYGNCASFKVDG